MARSDIPNEVPIPTDGHECLRCPDGFYLGVECECQSNCEACWKRVLDVRRKAVNLIEAGSGGTYTLEWNDTDGNYHSCTTDTKHELSSKLALINDLIENGDW